MRNYLRLIAFFLLLPTIALAQEIQLPTVPTENEEKSNVDDQKNLNPYMDDKMIVIGTGAITGVYYPAGGAMCRLINKQRKELGIRCAVEATAGSIYNIDALKNAEVDFGIVQSDWQEHAYNGTGTFSKTGRYDKLRHLFSLHSEAFTVIVTKGSDVMGFDDIKGRVVNIGPIGSGVRATMEELMKAKGWVKENFKSLAEFQPAEQAQALCDGRIDVMILATGHPNTLAQEVSSMCETRIVNVDGEQIASFVQSNPAFSMTVIPGGMYNGSPNDITTFGVKATVVSTSEVSTDIAYNLTKSVFDNLDAFKTLHPVFTYLKKDEMFKQGRSAPYHPGAEKYYKEAGLIK
jgi:TRAP transporter TAXI family solute receptor